MAVLLPCIKNHNTEFEIRKLIVETFGHIYGNHLVFIDGATNKSALYWKNGGNFADVALDSRNFAWMKVREIGKVCTLGTSAEPLVKQPP